MEEIVDLFSGKRYAARQRPEGQRIEMRLGADSSKDGAPLEEEAKVELEYMDLLDLDKKYANELNRDVQFYDKLMNMKPNEIEGNMEAIMEGMKNIASNPIAGELYTSALSQLTPYMESKMLDELLILKAKSMYEINSKTAEAEKELNARAYEKFVKGKPDDRLPISHQYNRMIAQQVAEANGKIAGITNAYNKAKDVYENETTYFCSAKDIGDGINVKANNVLIVDNNGEKITFNNKEVLDMKLKEINGASGNSMMKVTAKKFNSIEDDDELVLE